MGKYTIGIDFGSLSGRAVIVDVENGNEIESKVYNYPHEVMYEELPSGKKLGHNWAIQHPQDYLDVLSNTIPRLLEATEISPDDIIGIGVDFTSSTVMPVKNDGTPMSFIEEYKNRPHAYVKLWKHHAAQKYADKLNEMAALRDEIWLRRYGGQISSEWLFPKMWQVLEEDEEIYNEMDKFMEGADWITWQLTGKEIRSITTTGYKGIWNEVEGYPSKDFLKSLDERLENAVEEKLSHNIRAVSERAGTITAEASKLTGLNQGTSVSVGNIDAHASFPALKINEPGRILAIIGTSTVHLLLSEKEEFVAGINGIVKDGIIPGYYGYEAGQPAVGDSFAWFIENIVSEDYVINAKNKGQDIHEYLSSKSSELAVGESGLLALDWWNGSRSPINNGNLSGLILGMDLQTKPEEIYRALLESTAYGTKLIIETFENKGIEINEFYAAGGIASKNSHLMQIYSDVLDLPIRISGSEESGALGSAIFAAVAAGSERGGYDNVVEASQKMGKVQEKVYEPNKENVLVYKKLFEKYKELYNYFGDPKDNMMMQLRKIKETSSQI